MGPLLTEQRGPAGIRDIRTFDQYSLHGHSVLYTVVFGGEACG